MVKFINSNEVYGPLFGAQKLDRKISAVISYYKVCIIHPFLSNDDSLICMSAIDPI